MNRAIGLIVLIVTFTSVSLASDNTNCNKVADMLIEADKIYLHAMASGNKELTLEIKTLIDKVVVEATPECGSVI